MGEKDIEIDEDAFIKVYVLGHGVHPNYGYGSRHIASHINVTSAAKILSINEVAFRFEMDFTYYRPKIESVKLYFCNDFNTQKLVAEGFYKSLVFKDLRIDYYGGILTVPLPNKKYAFFGGGVINSASKNRRKLFCHHENNSSEQDSKGNFKIAAMLKGFEIAREKRKNFIKSQQRARREDKIDLMRQLKNS